MQALSALERAARKRAAAYEAFRLGLSRRRVKRPTGSCDRVLFGSRRTPTFSTTTTEFGCGNFEGKPPTPLPVGGGFITV
jgi:hypothetical protein